MLCFAAESLGSDDMRSSAIIPPPTVLDRVLKDIFHEGTYNIFYCFVDPLFWFFNLVLHKQGLGMLSLCAQRKA